MMIKVSKNREISEMVQRVVSEGWSLRHRGPHAVLKSPNGFLLSIPKTPRDSRAAKNFKAGIRSIRRRNPLYSSEI